MNSVQKQTLKDFSSLDTLTEVVHNATGLTGKRLHQTVCLVVMTMAQTCGNKKAFEHFDKRFQEFSEKKEK